MNGFDSSKDLTRWNRSGLRRFRYVDGNAITYLETLRLAMREAFTDADGTNRWQALDTTLPVTGSEGVTERHERWLSQYRADRRDYAWEILRAYARSAHVLTEHLDAYANESYLRTATQWDNVRRLVEMLDYHPAPPASAETVVALLAKEEKTGTLEAGFAFKNKPEDGSKPVIFETVEDLEVDYLLNELYAKDWAKSQKLFDYDGVSHTAVFPLREPVEDVSVDTRGVLLIERELSDPIGVAVTVTAVSDDELNLQGEAKPAGFPSEVLRHQVRLLLRPKFKRSPQLSGDNVVSLDPNHGLVVDSVVAWEEAGSWYAARVQQVDGARVSLSRTAPDQSTPLYLASFSDTQAYDINGTATNRVIFPPSANDERFTWALWDGNLQRIYSYFPVSDAGSSLYDYVSGDTYARVFYVAQSPSIATVLSSNPQELTLDGSPGDLSTGDWLIATSGSGDTAATISALDEGESSYTLELSRTLSAIETLYGEFEVDLRPLDHDVNEEPIFVTDPAKRSDSHSLLPLELEEFPELLDLGRKLIVAAEASAMVVTVKEVDAVAATIKVEPAIPGSELSGSGTSDDYTRHATTIYANVVPSGHGETKSQKILGSGDATQIRQTFDFEVEEVSHVADAAFPNGVRAAVEVTVDNRTWQQVSSLNDSDPEEPHYVVRMKEDGTLQIRFGGDGKGQRAQSGNNNLRIAHRVGAGLAGNLEAYSLEKEVKPHPLIDGLLQPMPATGGNAMESAASMRDNAPASVLTLERAVSLSDFSHLAAANSSVWQARAFRRPPGLGRADKIEVAVVPAGGGTLGTLEDTLEAYLQAHTMPGVEVSVVGYQSLILDLVLTLRIKMDEFDSDLVVDAVREAVLSAFALQNVQLGEPLYRSQVFEVVEAVEGVENCHCEVNPYGFRDATGATIANQRVASGVNGEIRRISAEEKQVIYMDEDQSTLEITPQEFSL